MNQQKRLLLRMVAFIDILIAGALAGFVIFGGLNIPILVPILLGFCAIVIIAISFIL